MNPFTTLGLDETATPAEVKLAFRTRVRQVHPDVAGDAGRQVTVAVIAAYKQALVIAQANATAAPVAGFVPMSFAVHSTRPAGQTGFVASSFRAVA